MRSASLVCASMRIVRIVRASPHVAELSAPSTSTKSAIPGSLTICSFRSGEAAVLSILIA